MKPRWAGFAYLVRSEASALASECSRQMEENGEAWGKLAATKRGLEELCLKHKICDRVWSAEELPETRQLSLAA